jgi:hypothetical protein
MVFRFRFSGISLAAGTELISVGALIYCVFCSFRWFLDPLFGGVFKGEFCHFLGPLKNNFWEFLAPMK